MKKILLFSLCLLIFIGLFHFLGYPFWNTLKSHIFMYFYDKYILHHSILNKNNINFYIPGGCTTPSSDWYPFILHHDASEAFSQYTGKDLSLMILYSFGAFDFFKGSSKFYDPSSPYFGAFYGGYVLSPHKSSCRPYGFDNQGHIHLEEIQKVPKFDQTCLVLPSIGCPSSKIVFHSTVDKITRPISYAGMEGWTRIDATIKTNGPIHQYRYEKNIGYIQYGKPPQRFYQGVDYPVISFKGRIYVKYIEELKATFFLYVMAPSQQIVDTCDKELLSKTAIDRKK